MATIEAYETSTGAKRYMVRYRTPQQTQTKKRGFRTKRDAQEFAATVEVEKMTGAYVKPSLGRITVGELAPDWLALKESCVAPSNYRTLESAWRIHVEPTWGSVSIANVEIDAVEQWIATMKKKSGATTVIRAYGVLAGILDHAVEKKKRLARNPARGVENLPEKSGKRRVYLSAEDIGRLADECGQHRTLVLVLGFTGIRWGEAVALRVRDVQFLKRRLSLHANAVQIGTRHIEGQTKSREDRSVPVPQSVLDELSIQCQGRDQDDLVFGDGTNYLQRPKSTTGWFRAAVKRAKVQSITPHDLRHSCASISISSGANVLALSRMLGHKSAKVTLDTYADLFDTDLDAVAAGIDLKCAQFVPKARPVARAGA
jgi:integrase